MVLRENHIECANCKNNVVYYTKKAEVLACPKCGNALLLSMGQTFISGKAFSGNKDIVSLIPLGHEITIQKINYQVVGIASFKEVGKPYKWLEYTLYNENIGFLTLSSFKNTFNLVRPIINTDRTVSEPPNANRAVYNDQSYHLYNMYNIDLQHAEGEFQYNISRIHGTLSKEYLRTGELIISHEKDGIKQFFIAEYVSPKEIEQSLGITIPVEDFTNPTETYIKGFTPAASAFAYLVFLGLLTFVGFLQVTFAPETKIFEQAYNFSSLPTEKKQPIITPSFELTNPGSSITVEMYANVSNDWFATSFDLINETTNNTIGFENGVEYYSGYSGGESWSEGSSTNTVNITNIKPGKYHIVITPVFSTKQTIVQTNFKIFKNRLFFSNYLVIAILAALFPIFYIYMDYLLDKKRWYHSDYSKYSYDE